MNFSALPGWKIIDLKDGRTGVFVHAELTTEPQQCPHCRTSSESLRLYGRRIITIKDSPKQGKPVEISLMRRRYRCMACHRTLMQPIPGMDKQHRVTARLIEFVAQQAFQRPFRLVAREAGLSEKVVRTVFSEEVKYLERITSCEAPRILGVDVVYIGSQVSLLLTDIEARRVINLTKSVTQAAFARTLLGIQNRWRIEAVIMEMSRSHRDVVHQMLPNTKILIDRCRVMSLSKYAIDAVQMHPRHRSCKLPDDCSELATAYALKARFMDVWRSTSSLMARRRYSEWMASVPKELSYAFNPLMLVVKNWSEEIFGFFDDHITDTYPQVITQQIKSIKRSGPRYDFQTIRAKVIYGNTLR